MERKDVFEIFRKNDRFVWIHVIIDFVKEVNMYVFRYIYKN